MKKMQKHKIILFIVSLFILLSLLFGIWWLGKNDAKKNNDKTASDQVIIDQEKESEDGLSVEDAEDADKENENTTPFVDSPTDTKDNREDQSDKEQGNESESSINDKNVEDDESTDNTDKDADVGLEQDGTEQTTGQYGDFF